MRRAFVAVLTAVIVGAPPAAVASADPIIQPVRCKIGDATGVYVGGKCSGPYQP
ncbi:MAG: hypothetical protein ABR613_02995 [Actinomycetota bacterium]